MHAIVGMDIGTSGCKAVVFDCAGNMKGYAYREYPILCDETGKMEQDADYVFDCLMQCLKGAVSQSGVKRVAAISISVQGDAAIPVDAAYRPLHNAVLGMDYRPAKQCEAVKAYVDEWEIYRVTGQPLHPINFISKILWFRDERSETYAEYIMARLGGEPMIDITMASRSMGMDIHTGQWSAELLGKLCIDVDKLSDIVACGSELGVLDSSIADELDIDYGTKLVAGGHDQPVGALGAGAIAEGMAVDSSGTAEIFSMVYRGAKINKQLHKAFISSYCHVVPEMNFSFAHMQTGGILLQWYRDQLGYKDVVDAQMHDENVFDFIQKHLDDRPSPVFVLPHFNGSGTPMCDFKSKGAILGLGLNTTRRDLFKGIIDGLTYELRINMDAAEQAGITINEIRAVGGGSKSALWMQTKADITGRPLKTLQCKESGCLGAAVIAAVSTGFYSDIAEGVSHMVRVERVYEPNRNKQALYERSYELYRRIYTDLKEFNHLLSSYGCGKIS
jgi:sugar (pentulose or hexulose) kinase